MVLNIFWQGSKLIALSGVSSSMDSFKFALRFALGYGHYLSFCSAAIMNGAGFGAT
ncbi:unnamed protein product [Lupinus luteus]|uniref:Uncharacterized protein n=1 Tax=Lupinus luteus TaxID=3873 RepID=A0AAV1WP17_LUPLU